MYAVNMLYLCNLCMLYICFIYIYIYIYIYTHMPLKKETTAVWSTKLSSHDDSGVRYGLRTKESLLLIQSASAVS